jgi:cytochrome c556
MKRQLILLTLILTAATSVCVGGEPEQKLRPTQPFMRHKLDYARGILEGITLERFDLVVTNASWLRSMAVTNSFFMLGNEGYKAAGTNFQVRVDALLDAAKEKNPEAATEAYMRVVRGCIECHRQYRLDQFRGDSR